MTNPNIPKVMRGLQIVEHKAPYKLSQDIPVPRIEKDNEILVKIIVAGYCHSDVMIQNNELGEALQPSTGLPMIPSHEGAGIVVAVGSKVTDIKVGDRVGTMAYKNPCGECDNCHNNDFSSCAGLQLSGVTVDGSAAEFMVADANCVVPVPASLSFEMAAPLMCAGSTIYAGLKKANLEKGNTVAIIGIGALGHLGVQLAKCMGLRVVAVDVRQAPLDLVRRLKHAPDFTIDATKGVEYALQEIGGEGVHASIIASDSNAAYDFGFGLTKNHGLLVAIGLPPNPIMVHYNDLIIRDLTIKSGKLGNPEVTKEMVGLVVTNGIEVKTRVYALENIELLLEDYQKDSRAGKFVLRISDDN
ncbi:chaperonin 10-like protein [Hysterangium stoloniferum]|nr:chaperonin 10-like protein [Hysterangium stoloniferum]KAF8504996.1 chaperonin 10-like protein [Hysterangium stoloniferum]